MAKTYKVEFTKAYQSMKKGQIHDFSRDIAKMLVGQKVAKYATEKTEKK